MLPQSWRTRIIPKLIVWDKCGSYGKWHLRLKIPKVNISREFSKRSWVKKLKVKEECSLKKGAIVLPVCCKEEKWCGTASVSRVAPNVAHSSTRLACSCGQGGTVSIFEELNQTWPIAAHDWLVATAKTALQVSEELHQTWPIAAHDWLVAADKVQLQV